MKAPQFDLGAARELLRARDIDDSEAERLLASPTLSISEIARIRGVAQPRIARQTLQNWGLQPLGRRPGHGGESYFDATAVWKAIEDHPGKGWRKDRGGRIGAEGKRPRTTEAQRQRIRDLYAAGPAEAGVDRAKWTIATFTDYLNTNGICDLGNEAVRRIITTTE